MLQKLNTSIQCSCGERLYIYLDDEGDGFYRVQHGERPEVMSPSLDGPAGERSFQWREKVHAYLSSAEVLRG